MKACFEHLTKRKFFKATIYPVELFERRVQEEIARSDENNDSFVYTEIEFDMIKENIASEQDRKLFLLAVLQCLQFDMRSSDSIGLLPDDKGFVVLMPESHGVYAWKRLQLAFGNRIADRPDFVKLFKEKIQPIVYPTCLEQPELAAQEPQEQKPQESL